LPPSTGGAGSDGAHAQARRRGARSGGPKSIHGEALGCAVPDCARPWRLSSHAWRVRPVAGGTTRCGAPARRARRSVQFSRSEAWRWLRAGCARPVHVHVLASLGMVAWRIQPVAGGAAWCGRAQRGAAPHVDPANVPARVKARHTGRCFIARRRRAARVWLTQELHTVMERQSCGTKASTQARF
jgi:hypothetical protein